MLENWLFPVELKKIDCFEQLSDIHFGKLIDIYAIGLEKVSPAIPNLSKVSIVIIGIGATDANSVRNALYSMSFPFQHLSIVDLGNVRKEDTSFLIPFIEELLLGNICPIIIGHSATFTLPQFQAYRVRKNPINLCLIDEKIRFTPKLKTDNYFLHHILVEKQASLFHCSVIGYQYHFTSSDTIDYFENRHFEHIRLGRVRANIEEMEPIIRDADMLSFNIASIRYSEAPGHVQPSPSGFFVEEACQLSRYAGMSDKITSAGYYGFRLKEDKTGQTAQVVSQLIWYFIDGFYHRKLDYPASSGINHLTEYLVYLKDLDYKAAFWKSGKSGRWWMEIPFKSKKKHERHRLIPCSYVDYQSACEGELPERLINALKRFEF